MKERTLLLATMFGLGFLTISSGTLAFAEETVDDIYVTIFDTQTSVKIVTSDCSSVASFVFGCNITSLDLDIQSVDEAEIINSIVLNTGLTKDQIKDIWTIIRAPGIPEADANGMPTSEAQAPEGAFQESNGMPTSEAQAPELKILVPNQEQDDDGRLVEMENRLNNLENENQKLRTELNSLSERFDDFLDSLFGFN